MRHLHHHHHICGCFVILPITYERRYLAQVDLTSQTTITPLHSLTKLTQTFYQPAQSEKTSKVRYCFPLYDGVTVCGYSIKFADKHLIGVVKQKNDAKAIYNAAVKRGETAGLLESLPSGVFGVTLGNVPAKTTITVEITYTGELKHDAGLDGLRYTIPTSIAPRYGDYPGEIMQSNTTANGGIKITVDVNMGNLQLRKIQSPSHPIAVSLGSLSSDGETATFSSSKASATLALGNTELDKDFILQLLVDDINKPQALVETHPTLPNQRAIMATLVPKFTLPSAAPEIVFVADQSGSMMGKKNKALVNALKVFVKSLPFDARFNICAFGNKFDFLWPKSQPYNEDNVTKALEYVNKFTAQHGGTEILPPLIAAFEQRLDDMPLEVMLLTDGEVWGEEAIFDIVNKKVHGNASEIATDARIFSLGIGSDVSHTLVEVLARAGKGFAQFVTEGEEIDKKVMRMLKGALSAHTDDYTAEVNFGEAESNMDGGEDEYELVERVNLNLTIIENNGKSSSAKTQVTSKSFFDESTTEPEHQPKGARYAHLPDIQLPQIVMGPSQIPPLYPFNRTTMYFLLGPEVSGKTARSMTIRARANGTPLELTIPIRDIGKGAALHQLAARKAIQELESGQGWLHKANILNEDGTIGKSVQEKYSSRIDEFSEREAVRLGVEFQVASKWTSFVAVQKATLAITDASSNTSPSTSPSNLPRADEIDEDEDEEEEDDGSMYSHGSVTRKSARYAMPMGTRGRGASGQVLAGRGGGRGITRRRMGVQESSAVSFGSAAVPSPPTGGAGLFSMASHAPATRRSSPGGATLSATASTSRSPFAPTATQMPMQSLPPAPAPLSRFAPPPSQAMRSVSSHTQPASASDTMRAVIQLQKFSGVWEPDSELMALLGISIANVEQVQKNGTGVRSDNTACTTILVIAWFKKNHGGDSEVWEMVVEKAMGALQRQYSLSIDQIEALLQTSANSLP